MSSSLACLLMITACYEIVTVGDGDGGSAADGGSGEDGGGGWLDGGSSDGAAADGGAADGGGGDAGWADGGAGDADGDGWTTEEGDCDDGDRLVNPEGDDSVCDGQDNDCDGDIDDDFDRDTYEPNDTEPTDLGVMKDESDTVIVAWLWPEDDEDSFQFYVEDGDWSWFDIELWLYDVPSDADYALELSLLEDVDGDYVGIVDKADDHADGGEELITYGGSYGFDDSGWYEARVYSTDGAHCDAPYTLQIVVGSWR